MNWKKNWKKILESIGWAAFSGALTAASEAMNAGHFEFDHICRAVIVGVFLSVSALWRQWNPTKGQERNDTR